MNYYKVLFPKNEGEGVSRTTRSDVFPFDLQDEPEAWQRAMARASARLGARICQWIQCPRAGVRVIGDTEPAELYEIAS